MFDGKYTCLIVDSGLWWYCVVDVPGGVMMCTEGNLVFDGWCLSQNASLIYYARVLKK